MKFRFIFLFAMLCSAGLTGCGEDKIKTQPHAQPTQSGLVLKTIQIGESVEGRPIRLHVFGSRGPVTLVFAAIHGDESSTEHIALKLIDYLLANQKIYENCLVAVMPAANPDGLFNDTRQNARMVDCNRNFPTKNWKLMSQKGSKSRYFGGQAAASEPETRAIIKAVELLKPAKIVSLHSWRNKPCVNFDGPARYLAEAIGKTNGYAVKGDIGYATPGSFGTWAGVERKIPTITIEVNCDTDSRVAWAQTRDAILACIEFQGN